MDTCLDRPERYILEALEPIVKFKVYKAFDNGNFTPCCGRL